MIDMMMSGLRAIRKHKWELLLLYGAYLIYGILVGSKISSSMSTALGKSMADQELKDGYNSNIFADLMTHQGFDLDAVMKSVGLWLPLFLLISLYLKGGLIANIAKNETGIIHMLKNGARYFLKYLLVTLVSLVAIIASIALVWIPFIKWCGDPIESFDTERIGILTYLALAIISLILIFVFIAWSIRVKGNISTNSDKPWRSAWKSTFGSVLSIVIFSVSLLFLGVVTITVFKGLIGMCGQAVFVGLVLGQAMVIVLTVLRVGYMGGVLTTSNSNRQKFSF